MSSDSAGQRQRAEVVAEQIRDAVATMAYPSGTITRLVREALLEARQEAQLAAVSIVEDWPLGIEDRLGLLDRLAREGAAHSLTSQSRKEGR